MAATRPRSAGTLDGYVLHHWDWSETSLILDVFTRQQGRIAVVAKGAKRPYSQLRAVLLPFQRIHVSLGRAPKAEATQGMQSEVQTLRGAEWAGGPPMLAGAALFSGFYLNELLMKLTARDDPYPLLFDAYAQTLAALPETDDGRVEAALRAFEALLLQQLGLLPELGMTTLTLQPLEPGRRYALLPDAGVVDARAGEVDVDGGTLIGLQLALEHGSMAALQHACSQALPEFKVMLRALLHYHLGSPILRTRQLMIDAQNLERQHRTPP